MSRRPLLKADQWSALLDMPAELRALFRHELGAERTRDLKEQMLAAGLPV